MSVTIMSRVFWTKIPALSYTDAKGKAETVSGTVCAFILLAIADNGNDLGENSYQSFSTLATKTNTNRYTAVRAVHALVENDYMTIAGTSRFGTNNFTINLDKLDYPPPSVAKVGRPRKERIDPSKKTGHSSNETGHSSNETGHSSQHESYLSIQNHARNFSKKIAGNNYPPPPPIHPASDGI